MTRDCLPWSMRRWLTGSAPIGVTRLRGGEVEKNGVVARSRTLLPVLRERLGEGAFPSVLAKCTLTPAVSRSTERGSGGASAPHAFALWSLQNPFERGS